MAALVETMFSVREKPWHGLGTIVTWKQINKSSIDTKRLKTEKPDIYNDYLTQSQYRRLLVA